MKITMTTNELRDELARELAESIISFGYNEISKEKAMEVASRYYSSGPVLAHGNGKIAEMLADGIIQSAS